MQRDDRLIPSFRCEGGSVRRSLVLLALAALTHNLQVFLPTTAAGDPVITAAGDIAQAGEPSAQQQQTARLVLSIDPTSALTLGDNQYPDGELADFMASFDPTWGRFKSITRPVPGNHDYHTEAADGYFDYFGPRAHRSNGGYYSFDLGAWHLVAVNSGPGSISDEQLAWIRRDLRRSDATCELAYWHHPRWSSGTTHGSDEDMADLWRVLFRQGVDVVLNGHEHNYERFALLSPSGRLAPRTGIREFVVGTGGADSYPFGDPIPGSQKRITDVFGVLRMTLHNDGYSWAFVGANGTVQDHGRHGCHA
jgi:Calcineurin-like phosphoesterase